MNIDELLQKYFEGLTSLEEEDTLIRYFQQSDIKDDLKSYAPIFRFLAKERQAFQASAIKKQAKVKLLFIRTISIAACLIAFIAIGGLIWKNRPAERSMVYVDGKRVMNKELFRQQALNSIDRVTDVDTEVLDAQIDMLNMFTE